MDVDIYQAFAYYCSSLRFTKVAVDPKTNFSIYAVKLFSRLAKDIRYFFALVKYDYNPVGTTTNLSNLRWYSFQSRQIEKEWTIQEQNLPTIDPESIPILNVEFKVDDRTDLQSIYKHPQIPIEISLLHDENLRNKYQYPDKIKLYQAINSFASILTL